MELDATNPLSFFEFKEYASSMRDPKLKEILENEYIYNRVTRTLKAGRKDTIKDNSYVRMLVYTICKIYNAKFETLYEDVPIKIFCKEFIMPKNHPNFDFCEICGCEFADDEFLRAVKKGHDDYDDNGNRYVTVFRRRKTGLTYWL